MIQIAFEPAFDPLHTAFRILRLRHLFRGALDRDHVRILDFFLLFPFRIGRIRLKQEHRKYRGLSTEYSDRHPYGELPDDRIIFDRMRLVQEAALESMAIWNLIDPEKFEAGAVASTDAVIVPELAQRVAQQNVRDRPLLDFLRVLATEYSLLGNDGLKHRTQLLEYRYDAI